MVFERLLLSFPFHFTPAWCINPVKAGPKSKKHISFISRPYFTSREMLAVATGRLNKRF